jgi:uncharacterized Ntn-hydrolase superfamily protein
VSEGRPGRLLSSSARYPKTLDIRSKRDAEALTQSSGLLIVRDVSWPVANLRVDWSDADPIADLERLWALYEPQLEAYVARAIDPSSAPSFGVPGDE